MSIWNTLYTGQSGINAFGDALQIVGDNIANVNTTGFKAGRANFEAMLGGTSLNSQRGGNGVRMRGADLLLGGGAIQQSERSLDMAINGKGYFAFRNTQTGATGYTRDGHFGLDNEGYLVGGGGRIMGYPATAGGGIDPVAGDLRIPSTSTGSASTTAHMEVQFDSDSEEPAVSPFDAANPATYNFATQMTITDSLGGAHQATVYYTTDATGNWTWEAYVDGGEVGQTPGTPERIGDGSLSFDSTGVLTSQSGQLEASFDNATAGQVVTMDFTGSGASDNRSGLIRATVDGVRASSLVDVSVDANGMVMAHYQEGPAQVVGAVAIAQIPNEDALRRNNNQSFITTSESGEAVLGRAGEGMRGHVAGSALEASNVDLSNEMVTMITYQRAFQSNAKTVTTADEMLQEIVNLKR